MEPPNSDTPATPETATSAPETTVTVTPDALTARLAELGVAPDLIAKVRDDLGATSVEDLVHLTEADLTGIGMKPIQVRKLLAAVAPAAAAATPAAGTKVDPTAELGENEQPSKDQIASFASMYGINPLLFLTFMNGGNVDMDLSALMPVPQMVEGYSPKRKDMFFMVLGQVEGRLGVPIIVINGDGAINRPLTIEYIDGLEEGRDAAENNIYFDADGQPHEVIRVGVDAQSVYDADPLEPSRALQKNGMGIGRVNWNGISLEVRQVAFYAVTQTKEIDPKNDAHQAWLRDHMKAGANRLVFHGQAPRAIGAYNEAARTGSLPMLRVTISRAPRRSEIMPRRRRASPMDLTGIGMDRDGSGGRGGL